MPLSKHKNHFLSFFWKTTNNLKKNPKKIFQGFFELRSRTKGIFSIQSRKRKTLPPIPLDGLTKNKITQL